MSQPANQATKSTLVPRPTANPRRTTLASVADFNELPGVGAAREPLEYSIDLPTNTANPRRTVLMVAPAPRLPRD
ncbi:hypothetical protein [Kitasatospora sp. MAP5-34]|uniref:hypothetical protein n=1 Tax=Kitasatospora sp. MAP5-34 TaxID=3035102 RepID=UPI002474903A|nr:hypothetical protein [Kitasatospora sp. MAP5-34]MDH6578946.1 hypothetical protein [Kitasatospora sp. MAP5-34]